MLQRANLQRAIFATLGIGSSILTPRAAIAEPRAVEGSDSAYEATAGPLRQPPYTSSSVPRPFSEVLRELETTARRTPERVSSVPIAVSAIATNELATRDIRRLSDLDSLVPSLAIDNAFGTANAARITLRGVTVNDPSPATDQAVGVFTDGIYAPRAQGLLGVLHDIERVEVVRGPQGTLFGKNTIGGAINIVTRKPEFRIGGSGEVRVGNDQRFDTRGTFNLPLIPEVAALRISAATNYDRGYQSNVINEGDLGTDRSLGARGQLLFLPTENLEVLLSGEYSRQDRRPQASKCKVVGPPSAELQQIQANVIDFQAPCAADQQRSEFKSASDITFAEDDLRSTLYASRVTWEIDEALTLRSITSFRDQDDDLRQDRDSTELSLASAPIDSGSSQQSAYSQELQLTGRGLQDRLGYMLGVYVFGENIDQNEITGVFSGIPGLNGLIPVIDSRIDVDNRSYSAYGQLSFALTEALSVTAGLRRTVERKRFRKVDTTLTAVQPMPGIDPPIGSVLTNFERSRRFSDFSPSLSLSYAIRPTLLGYASYSTGFRSGGFNSMLNLNNSDTGIFSPEDLTSYEVGFKSSFFDDRLFANGAVFYSIYQDIQRSLTTGGALTGAPTVIVRNAAEARLQGAELELVALPTSYLKLEASVSFFRSRYTDFEITGIDGVPNPSFIGVEDAPLPGQPDYSMTLAATYDQPLGAWGLLSTRAQWTQRGPQANDVLDTRAIRSDKYGLLDARMALALSDGVTELALFGTNLLDRSFINNGIDASDSLGVVSIFRGPPRRYGIELRRAF